MRSFLILVLFSFLYLKDSVAQKALDIGDTIFDLTANPVNIKSSNGFQLTSLQGKLVLLDWWSLQCAPCIAAMPKLDSLQKKFKDKLVILPVIQSQGNYDSFKVAIMNFWNKNKFTKNTSLPLFIDSTNLSSKILPHKGVPYIVWIDSTSVIRAMTNTDKVNAYEIGRYKSGTALNWENANTLPFEFDSSLLSHPSERLEQITSNSYSILAKYLPRVQNGGGTVIDSTASHIRLMTINGSIEELYEFAANFDLDRSRETSIKSAFNLKNYESKYVHRQGYYIEDWAKNNAFCYEVLIPKKLSTTERREFILKNLNELFGFAASIQYMPRESVVLKDTKARTVNVKQTERSGSSVNDTFLTFTSTKDLVKFFTEFFNYNPITPVFNEGANKTNSNIRLKRPEADENMLDYVPAFNLELKNYGYELTLEKRDVPTLVIE